MTTLTQERVQKYVNGSNQYLGNAILSLQQGEAGKSSELLWGSMAEALQAVAVSRNTHSTTHRGLRHFAAELARELGDRSINAGFASAEYLHSNFHEVGLEVDDVAVVVDPIRETVAKLLRLIPEELLMTRPGQL